MTEADANEAIAQAWRTGWDALHGPLTADPVTDVLEGEIGEAGTEWVRMAIGDTTSTYETLDGQQREFTTTVSVQIFTFPTSGTRRASELIDNVSSVFRDATAALEAQGIWPGPIQARKAPGDGAWMMRLVTLSMRWYG